MPPIIAGNELGKKLMEILGLPKTARSVDLKVAVDDVVRIDCEYFPELAGKEKELLRILNIEGFVPEKISVVMIGNFLTKSNQEAEGE